MIESAHRLPNRPGDSDQTSGPAPGKGRRLGIDVGKVRIGVAASDPDGILATPVETVRRDRSGKHVRRLAALVAEFEAVEVIVGLPRTLADRIGPSAQDATEVAEALGQRIAPIPVRLFDERLTTVTASGRCATPASVPGPARGHRPGRRGGNPAGMAGPAPQHGGCCRDERGHR